MTEDERAEEELELKRQTLQLEREKFRYSKIQGMRDRLGAAVMKASTTLMFSNASALIIFVAYYKQIVDVISKEVIATSTYILLLGLMTSVISFMDAVDLSSGEVEYTEEKANKAAKKIRHFGIFAVISGGLFMFAIGIPIYRINNLTITSATEGAAKPATKSGPQ